MYVQRNILWKTDVINNQLIPAILNANNIQLDWEDMPTFVPADPDEFDIDVLSKAIQRMKSVGGLTKEALEVLFKRAGLPTTGIEDLIFDDGNTSRGGEGEGTSGTGSSQGEGASSSVNSDNGGVAKHFKIVGDKIIDAETNEVINLEDLDDDGVHKS